MRQRLNEFSPGQQMANPQSSDGFDLPGPAEAGIDADTGLYRPGGYRMDPQFAAQSSPTPSHATRAMPAHADLAPPRMFTEPLAPAAAAKPSASAAVASAAATRAAQSRTYTPIWAGIGAVSALYLGIVAWQQGQSLNTALVPITESIEHIANEMADLKRTVGLLDARERTTQSRVAATETRLDGLAQAAATVAPPTDATVTTMAPLRPTSRIMQPATETVAAPVEAPAAAPLPKKKAAPPAHAAAATGAAFTTTTKATARGRDDALATPAATTPVATNPMQTGSIEPSTSAAPQGLVIASGPSLDSIRLSWSVLKQNHGAVLGNLEPKFSPSRDGAAFSLMAGPYANSADAQAACTALRAHGVGCRTSDFVGAPL